MRVGIVGAGLAGLACAERLQAGAHRVALFDKGRGPGGRMASRRLATAMGEASFDHGAQYFTIRDEAFRQEVERWRQGGVAAPWPAAGEAAWVGTPAMNAPLKPLAAKLDVRWSTPIRALLRQGEHWRLQGDGVDEAGFDAMVVAIPAEQAAPLLAAWDPDAAALATAAPSAPCWTVMAAFAAPVAVASDTLRDDPVIGWAARNSAKPGRVGPESWVIQASPAWSREHLEHTADQVPPPLLAAFAARLGVDLPPLVTASAHRWRYAKSGVVGRDVLLNRTLRLGACGDWLLGPRVESAWLSGRRLAEALVTLLA